MELIHDLLKQVRQDHDEWVSRSCSFASDTKNDQCSATLQLPRGSSKDVARQATHRSLTETQRLNGDSRCVREGARKEAGSCVTPQLEKRMIEDCVTGWKTAKHVRRG